jgi:hypothetical protein
MPAFHPRYTPSFIEHMAMFSSPEPGVVELWK